MRIAFVSDNTYPWFNGGIEKRRYIIMRKLASEGHDVHCFTMHRKNMPGREFTYKGIKYHSVGNALDWQGMYRGGSKRRSIRMPLQFSWHLFFKIFGYRFDILDADSFPFLHLLPLYVYTRVRGIRFAITWHEVWSREFWKRYLHGVGFIGYSVEWICAHMSDVLVANASTTKRLLESELGVRPSKIVVFPVAVDSEEMKRLAKRKYAQKNQFIVVSRLVRHKRVELAISAVAKTRAKLLVVGMGPDMEELQKLARKLAPGQVTFHGSLSTEQLFRSMLESKALIMPSEREGLSLVTIEALALGVPVVVADTSSLPMEVKHLCLEAKEDQLGLLLNKILENGEKYRSESMRMRVSVLAEFSGDDAEKIYEKIWRS